jgi:hypothetical protein
MGLSLQSIGEIHWYMDMSLSAESSDRVWLEKNTRVEYYRF